MIDPTPTLLVIDVQQGFLDENAWGGGRNNKDAEIVCSKMIAKWRQLAFPIIHIQHASTDVNSKLHPSADGFAFNDQAKPIDGELIIRKNVNSAFIGTDLKDALDNNNVATLVIIGLTTDHCVSTTTRMAGNFGYETYLVSDATAAFDKTGADGTVYPAALIHETALASLHGEFATVIDSATLLRDLT